ncbi:hypothetical protein [Elizabethkingia anophelis]|uniref:Lipoprotein n=1 Tax=Elizabethkingia anophelis TaxID=1117645 RepID=A0AAU8VDD5_9FLAO|nr:hypothetical protein [Elizabethkingia anophelis]AQX02253.1 hypothetical protein BBD32_12690 [Elizabethkingia anophelis]OPB63773.1 hypothetical protein BAY11_16860 [Elizabethkingia anophelis]
MKASLLVLSLLLLLGCSKEVSESISRSQEKLKAKLKKLSKTESEELLRCYIFSQGKTGREDSIFISILKETAVSISGRMRTQYHGQYQSEHQLFGERSGDSLTLDYDPDTDSEDVSGDHKTLYFLEKDDELLEGRKVLSSGKISYRGGAVYKQVDCGKYWFFQRSSF